MNNTQARYQAAADTALGNLNQRIGLNTKRMAGGAIAAGLAPGLLSYIDDQDTNLAGFTGSGVLTVAGIGAGGYLGYRHSHVNEALRDELIRSEIDKLKAKSKQAAKQIGPQEAVEQFARNKQALLEDLSPIDAQRAPIINRELGKIPEVGMILKDMDIGNKTPRDMRGMSRGALLGGLISLIPAYLALRNGEIES